VARVSQTCGKTTISYEDTCGYCCNCSPTAGCSWIVGCPDGSGGLTYTSGTGLVVSPPKFPVVTVAGSLQACAQILAKIWKRPVIVPVNLRTKTLRKRTLKGTPAEIAKTLGLELGSKRKTRGSTARS
jgi:hypothetical protein